MKYNTLKTILLLLIFVNFSCNNDDDNNCVDTNIPTDFTLKVKLVSETGDNLLNDNDFDLSLLKLTDPINTNTNISFSQITEDEVALITFNAVSTDSVNFEYDDDDKFYFGFHDIQLQIVNCVLQVSSYKALKINGDLVCNCSADDILVIPLNL